MDLLRDWIKTNSQEKDGKWANDIISLVRFYMQPLVNINNARKGMDYWLGRQDMSPIRNLFQSPDRLNLDNNPSHPGIAQRKVDIDGNPTKKGDENLQWEMHGVDFKSLPVMEKLKNMLIAELKKMGVVVEASCDDPSSVVSRKKDKALIVNKKDIEGMLSYMYSAIGQTPVKMEQHEARFGEKVSNGNTEDFDNMSLDPKNPADVHFFMQNFHKLNWEIAAQSPIDYCMKFNQVEDIFIDNWTNDLGSKKAIAAQINVSKTNGAIQYRYVAPETTYVYGGGRRKDYNDANAKCIMQTLTIKEMLDLVGDSFSFERETDKLFQAIFYASNGAIEITGISPDLKNGGYNFTCKGTETSYNYSSFMNLKVTFGYMEFLSQNDQMYNDELGKLKSKDFAIKNDSGAQFEDNQPANGKRYQNKARYEVPTYCAYFLALSALEHRMFDFGKIPYHQIEGYNDNCANWTILTYKEIGDSLALICAPFIDLICECWYKMKFEVRKAKAAGTDYNYDSILDIAEEMYADTNLSRADKFQKVVSFLDSSANGVWTWPKIDGKPIAMSNNQMNIPKPNGLTENVTKYWDLLLQTEQKMLALAGLDAPLRQGSPGNARDSRDNQFKALEYSQNNTYYIPDAITYMLQQLATRTMLYTVDIIQFKDIDTMAYKFLVDAVGEETLESISQLGKKSMHRYGIFIESMNNSAKKAKLQARIDFALQNGKINNAEALLIEEIKSPKKAYLTLAYFEQRNIAISQKNAMAQQQAQADAQMQLEQAKQKTVMLQGNFMLQGKKMDADAQVQSHLINQEGGLTKQEMKLNAESEQIYQEAHATILEQQASLNNSGKTTLPPAPPPQQFAPSAANGPSPQQQMPLSAIQQQMQAAQPGPTTA